MKTGSVTTSEAPVEQTVFLILFAISFSHLLNDMVQSLMPAIYPVIKDSFHLNFSQIGIITLVFQLSASILQPLVGMYTDKKSHAYSLPLGMGLTLIGLLCLSQAPSYAMILVSVMLIGMGSSIFHPESSRVAYLASGGRRGLAQSIFQLGGNAGSALGPLLAAWIIVPQGQKSISWFGIGALLAIVILFKVGGWYKKQMLTRLATRKHAGTGHPEFPRKKVIFSMFILLVLIFSKFVYLASISSYYTFYLIGKFHLSVQHSQYFLFMFLLAVAVGTITGGHLGDKFGRKYIIWISILGAAPFTLLLPYANLFWTGALSVIIGLIISSAFSAILVYGQELIPGKVGLVAGLFFGLAFGMGGLGSALLGSLADHTSINYVFKVCAFLPLIGVLTGFLPNIEAKKK
ncbi:MFS transporter [Mucilaginibacter sp.]|jgi:FSR family fosmidomycin resistance protein-like MFS transporter|uniref:MFS transporter n=1 Tax=Mucilaginibacter sp. TaxID=1882438 RepID=UPI002C55CF16|nr:MFS transporter [Mucilaginibacter sp.]HTI57507.1 MFS transporter [Mucilaginibacter sp.]